MRDEFDIADFRKPGNEVVESVAFFDRRRVEGDVEDETSGTLERGGIAAGDGVLFENWRAKAAAQLSPPRPEPMITASQTSFLELAVG
jgi:hypothetical protein